MGFYTSKELADWIQGWAEHQELTVSVILHRILRNSYSKPSGRARTRRGRRAGSERRHAWPSGLSPVRPGIT